MRFRVFLVVLLPLLVTWALQNWVGERTGFTALLLYLPQHPWALWPLGFALFGLVKRHPDALLAGAVGLLFWAHFLLGFRFFNSLRAGAGANPIRLMSYNIQRGAGGVDALERAIRAQNPDIVCLQESQGAYRKRTFATGAQIAARFAGWSAAQSGDVMTLSRFPLVSQRDFFLRGTRRILETTLQTPHGPLRVLNVHISTSVANEPYAASSWVGRTAHIVAYARPAAQARLYQIAPLRKAIGTKNAVPLVVAGDFNSPPRGLFYHAMSRGLNDAWRQAGRGTGHTFPSRFPVLPIDHVLTRGIAVQKAFVPNVRASDHRPLVVELGWLGG